VTLGGGLTFSRQVGLHAVAAAAVAGRAGVAAAVLLLHALHRQDVVALAQNHAWRQRVRYTAAGGGGAAFAERPCTDSPEPSTTVRLFLVQTTVGSGVPVASHRKLTVALTLTFWSVRLLRILAASRPEISHSKFRLWRSDEETPVNHL